MAEKEDITSDHLVAENEDRWAIFKSTGLYKMDVDIENQEQLNIFSGSIKRLLPLNNGLTSESRSRVLLAALSPTTFTINPPSQSCVRVPDIELTRKSDAGTVSFGLKRDMGISLYDWIGTRCQNIWEYQTTPRHVRFEESVRMVGRWFCAAIFEHHNSGQYVENPLESAFVQEENERIVFYSTSLKTKVAEVGIQDNLNDLVRFIEWLEKLKPLTSRPSEIDLYLKLRPANLPTSIEDLKTLSYFMCHAPIFWDYKQRDLFCFLYWRVRNKNIYSFDSRTSFTGDTLISPNWNHQLPSKQNDPLLKVYSYRPSLYTSTPHSLIPFHRNCQIHYNDYVPTCLKLSVDAIDQRLYRCFPDAIPKAYISLWQSNVMTKQELVIYLRSGPHGIDYLNSQIK